MSFQQPVSSQGPQQKVLGATQAPNKPNISWQELNNLITTNLRLKLQETPTKALAPHISNVVFARTTDSIGYVFKKLIDCGILSMPVLDVSTNMFIAFVDMLDILAWLVSIGELPTEQKALFGEWQRRVSLFESTLCTELLKRSQRHPWLTVSREIPVQEAIDFMVQRHANRLGLVEPNGTFSSILTQHRIIKWLAGMDLFEFGPLLGQATLAELGVGFRKVVTVNRNNRVFDAFLAMYNHRLSGVGITDDAGALVGNISISDLKDIGHVGQNFDKLFMSIDRFLLTKTEGLGVPPILYASRNSSLKEVLGKFKTFFVHRVYIVQKNTHIIEGVVTPSDILQLFSTAASTRPAQKATQQVAPMNLVGPEATAQALREAEAFGGLLPLIMNMMMAREFEPISPFEAAEFGTFDVFVTGPSVATTRTPTRSTRIDVKEAIREEVKLPPGVTQQPPTTGQHA